MPDTTAADTGKPVTVKVLGNPNEYETQIPERATVADVIESLNEHWNLELSPEKHTLQRNDEPNLLDKAQSVFDQIEKGDILRVVKDTDVAF